MPYRRDRAPYRKGGVEIKPPLGRPAVTMRVRWSALVLGRCCRLLFLLFVSANGVLYRWPNRDPTASWWLQHLGILGRPLSRDQLWTLLV